MTIKFQLDPNFVQGVETLGGQQDSDGTRTNEHVGQINAPQKNQGSGKRLTVTRYMSRIGT